MTSEQAQTVGEPPNRRGLGALIEAMRLPHWIKNAFVAAPILFSGRFEEVAAWEASLAAVVAFCLLSSAVYLINDVRDRSADRAHPAKRHRAIASGRLSVWAAITAAILLTAGGLGIAAVMSACRYDVSESLGGVGLLVWAGAYLLLNLLYSFWLKSHAIVDVIIVAMGFVLRAMGGAAAIAAPISPWLVVCTFTLCLFIALTKRRSEITELEGEQAGAARRANRGYTPRSINHMLTVSTAMAIITYSLYCLAPRTVGRFESAHMIWTIPLVIYGMFRYNSITARTGGEDPAVVLLTDKIMWLVVGAYVVLTALIWEFGRLPSIRAILDFECAK